MVITAIWQIHIATTDVLGRSQTGKCLSQKIGEIHLANTEAPKMKDSLTLTNIMSIP